MEPIIDSIAEEVRLPLGVETPFLKGDMTKLKGMGFATPREILAVESTIM